MTCRLCGGDHRGWERCKQVVHKPVMVVHDNPVVVHKETKHGKYANAEARKAYRREWMRSKRAKQ